MYHGDLWKLSRRAAGLLDIAFTQRGDDDLRRRQAAALHRILVRRTLLVGCCGRVSARLPNATDIVTYDVAIVGAGPSGAWAARELARHGARVLLLDPSHPRDKPCGGGVTGRALQIVADAIDTPLPAVSIRSARFSSSSSASACEVPLSAGKLVVASRRDFDGRLLEAARLAGADVVAARVRTVRRAGNGFDLDSSDGTRRARWLVGADGANSLVRRRLAAAFRRDQLSIATGYFAHGVTSEEIAIEFVADPPGYIWSFPRPDHLAIGICAQADPGVSSSGLRMIAANWMMRTRIADGARCEPYSWPIPSLHPSDLEKLQPSGPGWLLVGDAAGLVDPLTREGIYFALRSAALAADAIRSDHPQAWSRYALRLREECGVELARAARLKNRFFRPEFSGRVIDALSRSRSVRTVMADLVSGDQGYGNLKWRLARTLNLGLAAKFFLGRGA